MATRTCPGRLTVVGGPGLSPDPHPIGVFVIVVFVWRGIDSARVVLRLSRALAGPQLGVVLDDDGTENNPENSSITLNVGLGIFDVTEILPSGWNLTDITIVDPTGDSSYSLTYANATLNVTAGEWVNVTFTNTKIGKITVIKDAIPNDPQDFVFDGNVTGSQFTLDDDGIEAIGVMHFIKYETNFEA